jgi:virginiamycin A acetyltransferase
MKRIVKSVARLVAVVLAAPLALLYALKACCAGRQRAFQGCSQLVSLFPGTCGVYLRWGFYRWTLAECGVDACVGFGVLISHPTARLGARVYVGPGSMLGDVTLEEDVLVGSCVSVINGARQHGTQRLDVPVREQPGEYPRVTIGRDAWLGDRSVVMHDVGRHAVVGAGAVVTRAVSDYQVVAGNPAREIASRRPDASAAGAGEA